MFGIKQRVLIVEDQLDIRELIIMLFEDLECIECIVAEDGKHALEILDEFSIHAIITDIKMPNVDGVELCKEVRSLGFDGPIVVVTGGATSAQYQELCNLEVSRVFLKPVDTAVLKESIREILDKQTLIDVEATILQDVSKQLGSTEEYHRLPIEAKVELLLSAIED